MIFLSSPPLARTLPSYDQATVLTQTLHQATVLTQSLPFSQIREHIYVKVDYASPPLSEGETQRLAKAAHLCGVRVWRHLPSDTFHTLIVLSHDPLTTCDGSVGLNWTQVTRLLPFSQISDF